MTSTAQQAPTAPVTSAKRFKTARDEAAARLYDSEVALHAAHQSHVDAWITAASDRLHEAVLALAATEEGALGAH